MDWLSQLTAYHWLAIGLVLLALEVGAGIAYLLGPGFAALLVALIHWVYPLSPSAQLIAFAVGSVLATFAYARYFKNQPEDAAADGLHDRLRGMIGKETVLTAAIDGNDRIAFGDTLWRVRSAKALPAGCKIKVVDVDIDILLVDEVS